MGIHPTLNINPHIKVASPALLEVEFNVIRREEHHVAAPAASEPDDGVFDRHYHVSAIDSLLNAPTQEDVERWWAAPTHLAIYPQCENYLQALVAQYLQTPNFMTFQVAKMGALKIGSYWRVNQSVAEHAQKIPASLMPKITKIELQEGTDRLPLFVFLTSQKLLCQGYKTLPEGHYLETAPQFDWDKTPFPKAKWVYADREVYGKYMTYPWFSKRVKTEVILPYQLEDFTYSLMQWMYSPTPACLQQTQEDYLFLKALMAWDKSEPAFGFARRLPATKLLETTKAMLIAYKFLVRPPLLGDEERKKAYASCRYRGHFSYTKVLSEGPYPDL